MKLAIFNGSPRGKNSNTKVLIDNFLEGFLSKNGELLSNDLLIMQNKTDEFVKNFHAAEVVFIAFPLYADSMPGIVKLFIEKIGNFDSKEKKIFFLVQSGFPEGIQSEGVKKYLELLAKRWNMQNLGVIVKPSGEGIRLMPEWMRKKLIHQMKSFGEEIALGRELNKKSLEKLAEPYTFSKSRIILFKAMKSIGLTNLYWNSNLKKHGAFNKRFDAPFLEKSGIS